MNNAKKKGNKDHTPFSLGKPYKTNRNIIELKAKQKKKTNNKQTKNKKPQTKPKNPNQPTKQTQKTHTQQDTTQSFPPQSTLTGFDIQNLFRRLLIVDPVTCRHRCCSTSTPGAKQEINAECSSVMRTHPLFLCESLIAMLQCCPVLSWVAL